MGLPWSNALAAGRRQADPLQLCPLLSHIPCALPGFLFLKINLKAKLPEMSYKAQLSAQVAFDNAKQLGANKVTTSAKQMNQLLNVQSPALTKRGGAAQEGEWAVKLLGEAIFLSPLYLWSPPSVSDG